MSQKTYLMEKIWRRIENHHEKYIEFHIIWFLWKKKKFCRLLLLIIHQFSKLLLLEMCLEIHFSHLIYPG